MKRLTVAGALALLCAPPAVLAQSSGVLQGVERLACEAILCLSSSLQPGPCKPSLNHYFDIRKYRKGAFSWSRTVDARQAFLQQCPVSSSAESPRVLRRLHFLREWSHEQEQQVFP